MKTAFPNLLAVLAALLLPLPAPAQVNSGSNGSDGALNPTANLVIDMADHPDGIYHYTSVNIPAGVTVSFIPNAGNKPVVWLVQGNCVVSGSIDVSGKANTGGSGGVGGPGGWLGGSGGTPSQPGQGLGGGSGATRIGSVGAYYGGNGSYGTQGSFSEVVGAPGALYGNSFLLPMLGGSGGGGGNYEGVLSGGSGGGGAILIAASTSVRIDGSILATSGISSIYGGNGSGGAVRIVAAALAGTGSINVSGAYSNSGASGSGRVRIDAFQNNFGGILTGSVTHGFQPIIIPAPGQGIQLGIQSLAGVAVPASPSGVLANPDVIIPAQQANPIPVVVRCTNIPLNSEISVVVHPANGPDVQAVGLNNAGTLATSTATVSLNMPSGGGIIYAKAVTGIAGGGAALGNPAAAKTRSLAETGWSAGGEPFVQMEITAAFGGPQRVTYITPTGKRYPAN